MTLRLPIVALIPLVVSAPAAAAILDFEDLVPAASSPSPIIYPEASFISSTGFFRTDTQGFSNQVICAISAAAGCGNLLTVNFTNPVNDLVFQTIGDNDSGTLFVRVLFAAAAAIDLEFGYDDVFATYDTHDLSSYTDIVGLEMLSSDFAGVAFDNFSFTTGQTAVIPEPASWALMIAGFGLVGTAVRRRAAAVA